MTCLRAGGPTPDSSSRSIAQGRWSHKCGAGSRRKNYSPRHHTQIETWRTFSSPLVRDYIRAVDPAYYEFTFGALAPGIDAAVHYAAIGWVQGRDPNAWFCTQRYLALHPEAGRGDAAPLLHFLEARDVGELSDEPCEHALPYYNRTGAVARDVDGDPVERSLQAWRTLLQQYAVVESFFDAAFYAAQNSEVCGEGINPLLHFLLEGWYQGRDPGDWFSLSAY